MEKISIYLLNNKIPYSMIEYKKQNCFQIYVLDTTQCVDISDIAVDNNLNIEVRNGLLIYP